MSKARLKRHLLSLEKEQVVGIMLELYDASREAAAWLDFYLVPNCDKELERYKKAIRSQFYGRNDSPRDPRFSECNKLITAFKKFIPDPSAVADLMLYYVEQGCSLTIQFGDYEESFYTALENNFRKAARFISENGLMADFAPRMERLIRSVECCGYGFPETLWDFYDEYAEG